MEEADVAGGPCAPLAPTILSPTHTSVCIHFLSSWENTCPRPLAASLPALCFLSPLSPVGRGRVVGGVGQPLSSQIDKSPGRPHRALGACDGQIQPCRLADCCACLLWEVAGHTLPGHPEKPKCAVHLGTPRHETAGQQATHVRARQTELKGQPPARGSGFSEGTTGEENASRRGTSP